MGALPRTRAGEAPARPGPSNGSTEGFYSTRHREATYQPLRRRVVVTASPQEGSLLRPRPAQPRCRLRHHQTTWQCHPQPQLAEGARVSESAESHNQLLASKQVLRVRWKAPEPLLLGPSRIVGGDAARRAVPTATRPETGTVPYAPVQLAVALSGADGAFLTSDYLPVHNFLLARGGFSSCAIYTFQNASERSVTLCCR
jgi:hypothetical protein